MPRRETRIDLRSEPTVWKGPIKHSKRVLDRIKAAGSLRGAIDSLKEKAAAGFSLRFAAELREDEKVPDQTMALELVGRSVQTAIDVLVEADNVYCGHSMRRSRLSKVCDAEAREKVYPELVEVRRAIDWAFSKEDARGLHGIAGRTRRRRKLMVPQLEGLMTALRDPKHPLPRPQRPGATVDREGWLARLEPGYARLTAMLAKLEQQELAEARLRDERDYELESFDIVYSEALAFVRSVFRLGGYGEKVIWRLLPTVQRRRLKGKARQEREARADGRRPAREAPGEEPAGGGRVNGPTRVA